MNIVILILILSFMSIYFQCGVALGLRGLRLIESFLCCGWYSMGLFIFNVTCYRLHLSCLNSFCVSGKETIELGCNPDFLLWIFWLSKLATHNGVFGSMFGQRSVLLSWSRRNECTESLQSVLNRWKIYIDNRVLICSSVYVLISDVDRWSWLMVYLIFPRNKWSSSLGIIFEI